MASPGSGSPSLANPRQRPAAEGRQPGVVATHPPSTCARFPVTLGARLRPASVPQPFLMTKTGTSARSAPAAGEAAREQRAAPRSRRGRGGRKRSAYADSKPQLTSLPTHRSAYLATRKWLLARHGPVCAYCGLRDDEATITLDHVTPRKGQSAYDRRDNLVLACKRCNAAKADKPILAFLLGHPQRAANMLRYGLHLSQGLRELAEQVAGPEAAARAVRLADPDYPYAD